MLTILTAAWFSLIAYACWFASGMGFGILVERRRQRKRDERLWRQRVARRREIGDGIAERVRMHTKA